MKKSLSIVTLLLIVCMLVACAPKATEAPAGTSDPAAATEAAATEAPKTFKVVLIGNQRFGDLGTMDAFAKGLDRCQSEMGIEIKKLESTDAGRYEEDIRAMAKEGYDMIITTFPAMTDATITVASEFPKSIFYAIYQFVNAGDNKIANVWSTEFRSYQNNYVLGAFEGKLSTSKKLGYVYGGEEPSINSDVNGFVEGVKATCPECTVEVASANSWEDPAVGKEIAMAMISHGVDVIQTEAAKTQLGVIEAAKDAGIFFLGDNGDNYELYPDGFVTYVNASFENSIVNGCRALVDGKIPAGEHTYQDISNQGVFIPWEAVDRFVTDHPDKADLVKAAADFAKDIQAKIISGEIVPTYNEASPVGIQ